MADRISNSLNDAIGDLNNLETSVKTNVVSAINAVNSGKLSYGTLTTMDGNHRTITFTAPSEISILVGSYGSYGFMYLIHRNGGVKAVLESSDVSVSINGETVTVVNSGTRNYRVRTINF